MSTPRLPSAFITTTVQDPSRTGQTSVRVPVPTLEATQNDCWAGTVADAPPAWVR
jgi:hypothetical protein